MECNIHHSGWFFFSGKVYKGKLKLDNREHIYVAVKALKENASAKTQADFRREIDLISDLKHDNIVCILGVVLKGEHCFQLHMESRSIRIN